MAVVAAEATTKVASNKKPAAMLETSPDLVPADENFCDTNSAMERGEEEEEMNSTSSSKPTGTTNNNENNSNSSSFWDLLVTFYLPFLFVWIRNSMFGSAARYLIRTLIIGRLFVRLACMESVSEWITKRAPTWLQTLLHPTEVRTLIGPMAAASSSSWGGKYNYYPSTAAISDPHAWPPPAFTALALLTIVTLVIHPDGFTWIVVGKLRCVSKI